MPTPTNAPVWIETSPTRRVLTGAKGVALGSVTRLYGQWYADLVPTAAHSATTRHAVGHYFAESEARTAVERAVEAPPQIVVRQPFRPERYADHPAYLGPEDCLDRRNGRAA